MKTRIKVIILIIIAITILAAVLFYTSSITYRDYQGLGLFYLSDNGFQELLKRGYVQEADIVTITDKDLEEVPKLKELIDMAVINGLPFSEFGDVASTVDTIKEYHRYYAIILAEKYSKNPDDFFRTYSVSANTLEKYPNAYRYEFGGTHYVYNGVQYFWSNGHMEIYEEGQLENISTSIIKHSSLDPNQHIWATITDKDLEKMPLLKEAIGRIGTNEENSLVIGAGMSPAELSTYQRWLDEKTSSNVFEYDEKYFQAVWGIA